MESNGARWYERPEISIIEGPNDQRLCPPIFLWVTTSRDLHLSTKTMGSLGLKTRRRGGALALCVFLLSSTLIQADTGDRLRGSPERRGEEDISTSSRGLSGIFGRNKGKVGSNVASNLFVTNGYSVSATSVAGNASVGAQRVVVTYLNDIGKQLAMSKALSLYYDLPEDDCITIEIDPANIALLESSADIQSIEIDAIYSEQGFLDKPLGPLHTRRLAENVPYGITMIQAPQVQMGKYPVKVCMVDSGIARGHPDINWKTTTGANRVSKKDGTTLNWYVDKRGHGTHISGIVAAIIGNNNGVRGVGSIPLFITRGLSDNGQAYDSDIRDAMQQCVNNGAKVISLSLSGPSITTAMQQMLEKFYSQGILVFAASGNAGTSTPAYPAAHRTVISVMAVKDNRAYWPWSNYGPTLELGAPGYQILSTCVDSSGNFNYQYYTGTSMAAPHAAGAAALLWSNFPYCTNTQIRYALAYSAMDVGVAGCDNDYGYGIVQVKAAYNFLQSNDCRYGKWGRTVPPSGKCDTIDVRP